MKPPRKKTVKAKPTPRTDALVKELSALRSNTLSYPCEQALLKLCRELEQESLLPADADAYEQMVEQVGKILFTIDAGKSYSVHWRDTLNRPAYLNRAEQALAAIGIHRPQRVPSGTAMRGGNEGAR